MSKQIFIVFQEKCTYIRRSERLIDCWPSEPPGLGVLILGDCSRCFRGLARRPTAGGVLAGDFGAFLGLNLLEKTWGVFSGEFKSLRLGLPWGLVVEHALSGDLRSLVEDLLGLSGILETEKTFSGDLKILLELRSGLCWISVTISCSEIFERRAEALRGLSGELDTPNTFSGDFKSSFDARFGLSGRLDIRDPFSGDFKSRVDARLGLSARLHDGAAFSGDIISLLDFRLESSNGTETGELLIGGHGKDEVGFCSEEVRNSGRRSGLLLRTWWSEVCEGFGANAGALDLQVEEGVRVSQSILSAVRIFVYTEQISAWSWHPRFASLWVYMHTQWKTDNQWIHKYLF